MKYFIYVLFVLLILNSCVGVETKYEARNKNQLILLKTILTSGTINNQDVTQEIIENKAFIVLYTVGDNGSLYLANVCPVPKKQSFGALIPTKSIILDGEFENEEAEIETYKWNYQNTYDDDKGVATVNIIKQSGKIIIKLLVDKNNTAIYSGFAEKNQLTK